MHRWKSVGGPLGLALLAGTWLWACGSKSSDRALETKGPSTSTSNAAWLVEDAPPLRDVVVIAVDGLRLGAWPKADYPNLAALLEEGRAFPNHVANSTGLQAQMASLLTGLTPLEHGVGSVHERGRTFLSRGLPNFAVDWQRAEGHTLASVALPQLGPQVGGMDLGFDHFAAPDVVTEAVRDSERVHLVMQATWKDLLTKSAPLLALWQVADFAPGGLRATEAVRTRAQAALRSLVPKYPALGQAAEEVGKGPQEFESVRRAIQRQRGSATHLLFMEAVYAGQLKDLDTFVGTLMNELEAAQRLSSCAVVLVSLRGVALGSPDSEGPAFPPEVLRAPLLMWAPGKIQPGIDTSLLSTSAIPNRLGQLVGKHFGAELPDAEAIPVCDAPMTRWARFGRQLHLEQNSAAGQRGFQRLGGPVLGKDLLDAEGQAEWTALEAALSAQPVDFGYRVAFELAPDQTLLLRWRSLEGRFRGARAPGSDPSVGSVELGRGTPMSGRATLKGKGELWIDTYQREQPLVLEWSGATGPAVVDQGARLWMLEAPVVSEGDRNLEIQILRDSGVWTRLWVQGPPNRPLHLLAALVPEAGEHGRTIPDLEWATGPQQTVEWVRGRRDGAILDSVSPINTQFKESPGLGLAIALQLEGQWAAPETFAYEQGLAFAPGTGRIYVPDWWPGVTEGLDTDGWALCPGLWITRRGPLAGEYQALAPEAMEFVERMGRSE